MPTEKYDKPNSFDIFRFVKNPVWHTVSASVELSRLPLPKAMESQISWARISFCDRLKLLISALILSGSRLFDKLDAVKQVGDEGIAADALAAKVYERHTFGQTAGANHFNPISV